ncbi:hypothetical protein EYF80_020433 [Liparis tanakae]|uniref:Uncharacterized protein n=1 Tax=Liparis tanakae TaxID=230148 RepID=A0A4Z2HWL7_9TELE|nr:hypothetical protein EYF80_020433 [Liparis tanakae]
MEGHGPSATLSRQILFSAETAEEEEEEDVEEEEEEEAFEKRCFLLSDGEIRTCSRLPAGWRTPVAFVALDHSCGPTGSPIHIQFGSSLGREQCARTERRAPPCLRGHLCAAEDPYSDQAASPLVECSGSMASASVQPISSVFTSAGSCCGFGDKDSGKSGP